MKKGSLREGVLVIAALCGLGGVWSAGAARAVVAGPMLSLRADHMVLDAAAHGSKLLVATQSGQVEAFDWREGRVEEPLLVVEPPEGQELPPAVSSVAVSPSGQLCAAISSDGRLHVGQLGGPGGPGALGGMVRAHCPTDLGCFRPVGRLLGQGRTRRSRPGRRGEAGRGSEGAVEAAGDPSDVEREPRPPPRLGAATTT